VPVSPSPVDLIVFWTKNPAKMLDKLDAFSKYNYYFQFTVTPYGKDIEPGVPDKREIVETFRKLSKKIGKDRVVWRYDPILLSETITVEQHKKWFTEYSAQFRGYTQKCVISFIDIYRKNAVILKKAGIFAPTEAQQIELAKSIAKSAEACGIEASACAEKINLEHLGIKHGKCIDYPGLPKDKSQRETCGCVKSADIGAYGPCLHACIYCYANPCLAASKNGINFHEPHRN